MGILLSTSTPGSGLSSVKLRSPGDHADFQVCGIEVVPRLEFGTARPMVGPDGKPKTQVKLTVIIAGGTGVLPKGDVEVPLTDCIDEVATVYVAGRDRWDKDLDAARANDPQAFTSWSAALDRLGGLEVGDVCRWKFEGEQPGQGSVPRKIRTFRLRRPKPEEQARTERCLEVYRQGTAVALTPAVDHVDDPF